MDKRVWKKKTLWVISLFLIICAGIVIYKKSKYDLVTRKELLSARQKIATLTEEEKTLLTGFFDEFLFSSCAYPLIKSKPMGLFSFYKEDPKLAFWKQYQDSLSIEDYNFIYYPPKFSKDFTFAIIVCIDLCKQCIESHLDIFNTALSANFSSEEIYNIVVDSQHERFYDIHYNDLLLGILLGYGKNNANLYAQKQRDKLSSFTKEIPIFSPKWCLPFFVCDQSTEETKLLKNRYIQARSYIRWTLIGHNNLEVCLALLQREKAL